MKYPMMDRYMMGDYMDHHMMKKLKHEIHKAYIHNKMAYKMIKQGIIIVWKALVVHTCVRFHRGSNSNLIQMLLKFVENLLYLWQ